MSSFSRSDRQAIQRLFEEHIKRYKGSVVSFGMVLSYYDDHQSKLLNAAGLDPRKVGKDEIMEIWGEMNHHVWGERGIVYHGGHEGKSRFSYVVAKDKEQKNISRPKEEQVENKGEKLPMNPERNEELARSLVDLVYSKGAQGLPVDEARRHVFNLANSKNYALDSKFKFGHVMRSASGGLKFGDKRILKTRVDDKASFVSAEFLPDKGKKVAAENKDLSAPKTKVHTKSADPTAGVYSMPLPKTGVRFEYSGQQVVVKPEGRKLVVYILLNGEWVPFAAKI